MLFKRQQNNIFQSSFYFDFENTGIPKQLAQTLTVLLPIGTKVKLKKVNNKLKLVIIYPYNVLPTTSLKNIKNELFEHDPISKSRLTTSLELISENYGGFLGYDAYSEEIYSTTKIEKQIDLWEYSTYIDITNNLYKLATQPIFSDKYE